ncbi:hypothetical protein MMC28_002439 [Mycoblastus sanguinarius]|nr:hypothetical protein [Mycoblastus sanguinarius]
MAKGSGEKQIGRVISQQTVDDVLRIALKTADALCGTWCRSWGHGNEMDQALALLRDAVKVADRSAHESLQVAVHILLREGHYLKERLFRKGNKADADEAVVVYQEILLKRDPSNLRAMIMLCYIRHYQYEMTGERWMLDESIEIICEVLVACPYTHPDITDTVIFAATCLKDRAELDACIDDLDVMIELLRLGVNTEDSSGDGPALFRLILAEGLALRYDIREQENDIAEAENMIKASEDLKVHVRHDVYRNLVKGGVFHIRFKKYRQHKDIVASAQAYTDALIGLGKESARPSPVKFSTSMKLAQVLREGYHKKPASLMLFGAHGVAKRVLAEAVAHCQDWQSDHTMIEVHRTLGEIQRSRYYRYLTMEILDDSISHFRQCVKLTSRQDARFGARAARLSAMLRVYFTSNQTSSFHGPIARHEAVYWIQQLLQSSRPFQPAEMQECLMEIGDLLQDLHRGPRTVEVLDRAISHYLCAVNIKHTDFDECVGVWRRVAQALIDKGDLTGRFEVYESAQVYLDKIETLATQRNCRTTGHLPLLARLHEAKYNLKGAVEDATRAVEVYYKVFHNSRYEAHEKITAARRYTIFMVRLSLEHDSKSRELIQKFEASQFTSTKLDDARTYTIDLMLQLVSDGSDRSQQLSAIRREALTPLFCLWSSRQANKSAFEMVRLYERGRSVLWDRLINSKTQTEMLEEKHKELATRYRDLRRLLANPTEPDPHLSTLPQDRYQTAAELDEVIKEIHGKTGFEDFLLLPLSKEETQNFASQGSIIYLINGNTNGPGFALTISSGSVSVVNLPGFTENRCREHYGQLQRVFASWNDAPDQMDQLLSETLKWLWYSAAEPVLQALRLLREDGNSNILPRVWWVTSNWISRLPIHAAGDHKLARNGRIPSSVMDNVVSSYTPTLRALKYSRARLDQLIQRASNSSALGKAMLVAMQDTPDRQKLKNAVPEVVLVRAILEPYIKSTLLLSPKVTRKDVIQNLRKCTIAHLACHGEADHDDPLRSKLLFQDWGPKALRVGFLMRMEMANCQLAYLSACQTAVIQDEELAEEGLHLSGAFQMAGVPNTIATSWAILDKEAVDVAVGFYRGLRDESGDLDVRRCARSLHATIIEVRDRGSSPYVWGSYAHFGA